MDNTYTIATVFLLIAVQIAQGKPSDSQLCVQVTVCGHDGKIYPTPCDAPSFPPPCYDYKRITKGSCICEDGKDLTPIRKDNPCSHGTPLTNWSGSPLVCGGGFHPVGTKFDRCPKDYSCNFKFAAFDGPALCCPKEPICKSCESIVEGQKCGQDGGPYRLNCTQCCQSCGQRCGQRCGQDGGPSRLNCTQCCQSCGQRCGQRCGQDGGPSRLNCTQCSAVNHHPQNVPSGDVTLEDGSARNHVQQVMEAVWRSVLEGIPWLESSVEEAHIAKTVPRVTFVIQILLIDLLSAARMKELNHVDLKNAEKYAQEVKSVWIIPVTASGSL